MDEIPAVLRELKDDPTILTLNGLNTDSGKNTRPAAFDGMAEFKRNAEILHPIMAECRVIKTEMELEALRYSAKITCEAHKYLMRMVKPGMKVLWISRKKTYILTYCFTAFSLQEYQCESLFLNHVYYFGGARHVCYNCITCTGPSGSILHYGHAGLPNDQTLRDGHMVLFDMGAEYYRFCSDITCSYPVNGKFTADQKMIYNSVLKATLAVIGAMKPGVSQVQMHLLANRTMLQSLKEGGLLQGWLVLFDHFACILLLVNYICFLRRYRCNDGREFGGPSIPTMRLGPLHRL